MLASIYMHRYMTTIHQLNNLRNAVPWCLCHKLLE